MVLDNMVIADTVYSMLVLGGQMSSIGWLVVLIGMGFILLKLRDFLLRKDSCYLKLRVSRRNSSDCGRFEEGKVQNVRSRLNKIYLSITFPLHKRRRKLI